MRYTACHFVALTGRLGCVSPAQLVAAQGPESRVELRTIFDHQQLHPAQGAHAEGQEEAEAREAATEHPEVGVCLTHVLLSPPERH